MASHRAFCSNCNAVADVEPMLPDDPADHSVYCTVCDTEFTFDPKYANFVVGLVLSVDSVSGGKDYKKCMVQVTPLDDGEETVKQIVTNAKNITVAMRVVCALEGAVVPAGSNVDEDPKAVLVKSASVGGVKSDGMLCDSWMLDWTGGAKGVVQELDDSFPIGGPPPSRRPRKE